MTASLAHLHYADAAHEERIRSASAAPKTSRRIRRGGRGLRDLLAPRLQPRPAW
jgi:hypothetical protein